MFLKILFLVPLQLHGRGKGCGYNVDHFYHIHIHTHTHSHSHKHTHTHTHTHIYITFHPIGPGCTYQWHINVLHVKVFLSRSLFLSLSQSVLEITKSFFPILTSDQSCRIFCAIFCPLVFFFDNEIKSFMVLLLDIHHTGSYSIGT